MHKLQNKAVHSNSKISIQDNIFKQLKIRLPVYEIKVAGIQDQDFHLLLRFKETKVTLLDLFEIIRPDIPLIGSAS